MQMKCQSCGASQNAKEGQNCTYCGSVIIENKEIENRIDRLNANGNLFKLAEAAFEGEDYDEAINYYNRCLEIDSEFFEAWLKKGLSQLYTSTVGNIKATQAVATLRKAISYAENKESLKKRIKAVTIPFALNYYTVCVNHFLSFMKVNDIGGDVSHMLAKANSLVEFLCENCDMSADELESIYIEVMNADKSFRRSVLSIMFDKDKQVFRSKLNLVFKETEKVSKNLLDLIREKNPDFNEIKKGPCFIATAAMGDYNHPVVVDLRIFRDKWLLKRNWGVVFTSWYYAHGPKAANVIEKSKLLKTLTFILIVKPLQLITKLIR